MEPLESPRVEQVVGVLNRGEDTDGERTDDELDYPSQPFVREHDDEGFAQDSAAGLEVTGEGTAGGPFGLKKVLFVRKKSGLSSKDDQDPNKSQEPTLKDRFNKLGAGVGERFAALGSIMQDHGKTTGSGAAKTELPTADASSEAREVDGAPQGKPPASGITGELEATTPRQALQYFQEYDLTFTIQPQFSVVEGPGGKGAMVSWGDRDGADTSAEASSGTTGADASSHVPPSGAVILAVAGESTVDADASSVVALLMTGNPDKANAREEDEAVAVNEGDKTEAASATEAADGAKDGAFPLIVRFREQTGPRQDGAHGSGAGAELFRSRMKAMATGIGNLFQVKEAGGSVVRDGSEASNVGASNDGARTASDAFVLTFAAANGTADGLPFTMAEMIGGRGVVVSDITEDYAEALVRSNEAGVSAAGTAAVVAAEVGKEGEQGVAEVLAPGAVMLRVAGQNVEGNSLERVKKVLDAAAAEHLAVKVLFRRAPPIYRASVAAELALEAEKIPHVHVGTWQPVLKRRAGVTLGGSDGDSGGGGGAIGLGYGGEEWEDVRETMTRAQRFLNGFRSVGIRVDSVGMQTVSLPRNIKSAYAGTFDGRLSTFQQAVRLWFSFPDERTVSLKRPPTLGDLGLTSADTRGAGALGSWVTVTATDGSPCAEAGVPVGENSILTHVNGLDVSPAAYRSLAPLPFGEGEGWAAAVLALESVSGETISLTFV